MQGWDQDDPLAMLKQAMKEKTPETVPNNAGGSRFGLASSSGPIPFSQGSTISIPRGMKTATGVTTMTKPVNTSLSNPARRRNTPPPPPTDSSPPKIKITAGFSLSVNKTPPTPVDRKEIVKDEIQEFSEEEQPPSNHQGRKENQRNSLPIHSQRSTHSVEISREQERRGNFIQSQSGLNLRDVPSRAPPKANMRSTGNIDSLVNVGRNDMVSSMITNQQSLPSLQRTTRSRTNKSDGVTVLNPPTAMPSSSSNRRTPPVTASSSPPINSTKTRTQPSRSAKKVPKEPECIELLDDEEEEVERKKWIEPFLSKIYPIKKVYFGVYEQKPVEEGVPNYLRIDGSNNCFLFVFGPDKQETLQFFDIRNYQVGCYDAEETTGYLMLHIQTSTDFQYSVVGSGKCLDPTTAKGYRLKKYISILMPLDEMKDLESALRNIPSLKSKSGIPSEIDNSLVEIINRLSGLDQQKIEVAVMKELQVKKELFNTDLTGQRVTRRRASVLNSGLPTIYSAEDSRVYVIYPPEIEATDAVTISYGDLRRLEPSIYFNDNLIDLKIKHLISQLPEEKRTKVHAFSCLFYAKLLEAKDPKEQHQLVHRWTKNVDLFSLEFILFPINLRNHWSLMVMARPQAWIDQQLAESENEDESEKKRVRRLKKSCKSNSENESKKDEDEESEAVEDYPNLGVFLHMDSLRMHPSAGIANILGKYLLNEKQAKYNADKIEEGSKSTIDSSEAKESNELIPMDSTASVMIIDAPQSTKKEELLEEEAIIMNTDEEGEKAGSEEGAVHGNGSKSKRKLSGKKLTSVSSPGRRESNCVKCMVPMQENGYDCGVFVIRFAEMVLEKWPTTTINDIQDKCRSQFSGEFSQEDIHIERTKIRSLLESLREDWLLKNPDKMKEQKEKEIEKDEKSLNKEKEKENKEKDDDNDLLFPTDDMDGEAFYNNELTVPTTFPCVQNDDEEYFLTKADDSNPASQNKEKEEEEEEEEGGGRIPTPKYLSPAQLHGETKKPTAFFSKDSVVDSESEDENQTEKLSSFRRPMRLTQALQQKESESFLFHCKQEEEGVISELKISISMTLGDSDDNVSTQAQFPPMQSTIPDEDDNNEMISEPLSESNDSDDICMMKGRAKKRGLEEREECPPITVSQQQAKKKKKR